MLQLMYFTSRAGIIDFRKVWNFEQDQHHVQLIMDCSGRMVGMRQPRDDGTWN